MKRRVKNQFSKRGKMAAKCLTCDWAFPARAAHARIFNEKNSAYHFMQSEREHTLVRFLYCYKYLHSKDNTNNVEVRIQNCVINEY